MLKLFTLSTVALLFCFEAQAQTCLKSVNISNVCGPASAKSASGVCLNGVSKSVGSNLSSCQSASVIMSQLNSICQTSGNCSLTVPQVVSNIRSILVSKTVSGSLVSLEFKHSAFSPLYCSNVQNTYRVVLSSALGANQALLAQVPSQTNWLSVNLSCSSAPVSSSDSADYYNVTQTYTYPSGCTVASFAASSPPSTSNMMCY